SLAGIESLRAPLAIVNRNLAVPAAEGSADYSLGAAARVPGYTRARIEIDIGAAQAARDRVETGKHEPTGKAVRGVDYGSIDRALAVVLLHPRRTAAKIETGADGQIFRELVLVTPGDGLIRVAEIRWRSDDGAFRVRRQAEKEARERITRVDNPRQAGDIRGKLEIAGGIRRIERIHLIVIGLKRQPERMFPLSSRYPVADLKRIASVAGVGVGGAHGEIVGKELIVREGGLRSLASLCRVRDRGKTGRVDGPGVGGKNVIELRAPGGEMLIGRGRARDIREIFRGTEEPSGNGGDGS